MATAGPQIRSSANDATIEALLDTVRLTPAERAVQGDSSIYEGSPSRPIKEDRTRRATKIEFLANGLPEDVINDPNFGGFEIGNYHPLGTDDEAYRWMTVTNRSFTHWIENAKEEAWTKVEVNYERATSARTYEIHETTANVGIADWYSRYDDPPKLLHDGRSAIVIPTPMPVIRIHYPLAHLTVAMRRLLRSKGGSLNIMPFLGDAARFWKAEAIQITQLYGDASRETWCDVNIILRGDPIRQHAIFTPQLDKSGDFQIPKADTGGTTYGKPGDNPPHIHRITHTFQRVDFDAFLLLGESPSPPP